MSIFAALQGGLLLTQTMHSLEPLDAALDGALTSLRAAAAAGLAAARAPILVLSTGGPPRRRYSAAAARLANVAAISFSACAALWSPATRARMANHRLRWSTQDSVTRHPAPVSSNS